MALEETLALSPTLSPTVTIQLDWVAQPTWLCSAATCRRVWSVAGAHRPVLPESGGLAARQHGQVARATLIFTESFPQERGKHSPFPEFTPFGVELLHGDARLWLRGQRNIQVRVRILFRI
ncbi:MAG: hypothetical protein DME19_05275 [Verrucomicrobia bacterium]|nr:MAG: hypothetical protein DME19_05275 [Verrucomicrobiota bacterium]